MHLYMSGTPRNDPYQTVENRLCTHRLFSMHGEYEKQVLRWVSDLRSGIMDSDTYLQAYPQHIDLIKGRDARRRVQQRDYGRTFDWDTAEVLTSVCKKLDGRPYPRAIMLDSGAFTAWNKGEETTVDSVRRKYSKFIEIAGDMFDEIWAINLDVIPGEKGRDATPDELKRAVEVSDINFDILVKEFGDVILPVYHQGESVERLRQNIEQVAGKSNYLCVSPRNDLAEGMRVKWSRDAHAQIKKIEPGIATHGLATTGNRMVRNVPWYSGDSAAWVQHGGYGMIDIFHEGADGTGMELINKKFEPHYMNYFVSLENVEYALDGVVNGVSGHSLGLTTSSKAHEIADAFKQAGIDPDDFPFSEEKGHYADDTKSFAEMRGKHRVYIRERVERLGFPFEVCFWDSRVRNLICMAEFVAFSEWATTSVKEPGQIYLLGDL